MDLRKHGVTSNLIRVVMKHSSTGAPLTGLTDASASLIIGTIADVEATTTRYRASSSEVETISTLGTFAAPTSGKCRFKEVDATNHPGLYEIQLADARFSVSNARRLVVSWSGATNLLAGDYEIRLVAFDPQDTVRLGLTALPNAAAEASGGLATLSAAQASNGTINANVHRWLTGTPNALASGRVDSSTGAMAADVVTASAIADNAIDAGAIASDAITAAKIASGAITSAKFAAGAIDATAIANNAIDAATFAADVDAEILSYLVDDATRIDASALNTLSGHDPGETIAGATDLMTANVTQISGDSAAADNAESFFDGTGYAGTNNVIPTVTTVNGLAANTITATSIQADAITAAKIQDGAIDRATFAVDTGLQTIRSNTAQDGAGTSITLDASASAVDDFYNNTIIFLTGGTGAGQARFISDYVGSTKVATVPTWATNPANGTTFAILPFGSIPGATAPTAAEVADAVWDESTAGHTTSGTFGEQVKTDIDDILVDTGTTLQAEVDGIQADTEDIQSRLPEALVSGRIDASVGAYQSGLTPLQPTVSGRTLDVTAAGEAGIDWANIGSPTTTQNLSGTTVKTATDVETDTQDIQGRLPAALVGGRIDANAGAISGDATAADNAESFFDGTGYAGTNNVIPLVTTVTNLTNAATAGDLTATMKASVNTEADTALADAGVTTTVTGRIDAAISTRASQTSVDTVDDFLDTEIAAIKAKTDNLPSDPADASDIAASFSTVNTKLDTIDDFLDTEVAAIKAKTDSLTFTGAGRVDANVAAVNDSTTGVDKLSAHLPSVLKVVVGAGSTTTSIVLNASTGINGGAPSSTNDFYNGAVIVFTSGTLAGQRTDITDYVGSTVTLTVTALTSAPSAADTAVIV